MQIAAQHSVAQQQAIDLDLVHKSFGGLGVHFCAIAQGATEQQGFVYSSCSCVSVKLLHIASHTGKGGLLLGVPVNAHITLNLASCSTAYTLVTE